VTAGLLLVLAAAAAVIAWIVGGPMLAARRRAALRVGSLTDAERAILSRRVPLYRCVPPALRERLEGLVKVFVAEKDFVGCGGLEVTAAMKLTIAAQACLLVLGRDEHVYDELRSVLVYPSQFVVPQAWHDEDGVVTEEESVLAGQAWDVSRILLSWEDVTAGGRGDDAYNVVVHEFAHYLDHETGVSLEVAGREVSGPAALLAREYEALCEAVDRGGEPFLDPYAAEDEAEFFAVASEAFIETPRELAAAHPDIYAALAKFYRLDPAGWPVPRRGPGR
jgi:MtfA peptidase